MMHTVSLKGDRPLEKASNMLSKFVEYVCILTMASMTIVVLLGVIFRYVLMSPLNWSEELSRYLMIWGAAMAVTIGVKEKEHVGLTILMDQSKSRTIRIILNTVVFIVTALFYVVMIFFSIKMTAEAKWQFTQGLGITMVLPSLAIPVAMTSALVQLIFTYLLSPDPGEHHHELHAIDI